MDLFLSWRILVLVMALGSNMIFPSSSSSGNILQKTFFNFLHVTTSYDLSAVFLVPKNSGYLSEIIQLLICAACSHKDILVRKSCVQVFIKLIKN
jgi:hypothetical protein